ncbi:hypothetical protein N510_003148 [Firmicutes bacterium ASF500]|nr:hypothetical protein N510_003148 [Firmicutes bacterium ASF500]
MGKQPYAANAERNTDMTIVDAIKIVLTKTSAGLTSREIYEKILEYGLYEFPAVDPHAVVNCTIRRHCADLNFPTASPKKHFKIVGHQGKRPQYALIESGAKKADEIKNVNQHELLPEELIQVAYEKHISSLKNALMDAILKNDPAFFEQLVVDLLIAMGYGNDKTSGIVVGGSHDGGIDGIIEEDKLGLDQIYLQAKRYQIGKNVEPKDLQAFVGAMQNVQKGVFITTSSFTKNAVSYAKNQQQKSLKLIDGALLVDLMVKHEVGIVRTVKPFVIYRLDQSYFG